MKYVAFLRGIMPMNPNMRNEKLRLEFERLGFHDVLSVISSGNIIFESSEVDNLELESMIERAVQDNLEFKGTTFVRSKKQLEDMIARDPFKGLEHSRSTYLNVTFLKGPHSQKFKFPYQVPGRGYKLLGEYDNAIFSVLDLEQGGSPDFMIWLEKNFGRDITTRTWKTVNRVLARMS